MPWFKVDDGWWSHPKTLQISDSAQALWIRAGTWSMAHLTDGFIPEAAGVVLRARPKAVAELVDVGMWDKARGGHQFHDWDIYQPPRSRVEAERAAAAERKRKSRESRRDTSVTGVVTGRVTDTSPTRPDPTRPLTKTKKASSAGTTGPFCSRHPNGTEEACGACRTARLAFEDARKAEKTKPTPTPRAAKPDDGHRHKYDGDYCIHCQTRRP